MKAFKLMFVKFTFVHRRGLNVLREPLLELFMVIEKLWHDKMKEGPKLCHRVLNRRASQKQSIPGVELQEYLPSTTCIIFDGLSFIKNHVIPFDF